MKNILILGASSDLGISLAYKFASENYNIILASRNTALIEKTSQNINREFSIKCDFCYFDILNTTPDELMKKLKNQPDIIVSTVGFNEQHWLEGKMNHWADGKFDKNIFNKILSTNFTYLAILIEEFINQSLNENKQISIIALASIAGIRGRSKNYVYGSAKAALIQYLSGLRQKYFKKDVYIMTVIPGFIKTKSLTYAENQSFLAISSKKMSNIIYKAFNKKKEIVYGPYWFWISIIIKNIPEKIFKKLNF